MNKNEDTQYLLLKACSLANYGHFTKLRIAPSFTVDCITPPDNYAHADFIMGDSDKALNDALLAFIEKWNNPEGGPPDAHTPAIT